MSRTALRFENLAELLKDLGGIHPRRVRAWPPLGRATERDLLHILEHENCPCELIDGILVDRSVGVIKSAIALQLAAQLANFANPQDLGMLVGASGPFRLRPKLVRCADVAFVFWDRLPNRVCPEDPIPDLYPDLAVEVLSEGNTKGEMDRKLKEYFLAGTRLVWYVDPDSRSVEVFTAPDESITLTEKDALDGGDVLPGFRLPLKELFARLPRPRKNGSSRRKSS